MYINHKTFMTFVSLGAIRSTIYFNIHELIYVYRNESSGDSGKYSKSASIFYTRDFSRAKSTVRIL